jgi:hypothetical protein
MVGIHRRDMAVAIALCGVGGVPPRGSAFAPPSSSSRLPPPPAVVVSTLSSSSSAESSAAEVVVSVSVSAPAAPDAIVFGGKRKRTLRIAVVGAGAVGSYYGGRLWEGSSATGSGGVDGDGDDDDDDDDHRAIETTSAVAFHLRGEHYDHCTRHGLSVSSCHGDFDIPPSELMAYRTTEDMARSLILAADDVDDDDDDDDGSGGGGGGGEYFDWVVCALKSTSVSVRFRSFIVRVLCWRLR